MCGIAGVVGPTASAAERRRCAERALALLRHRGPDGAGIYLDDVAVLGAVRLTIRAAGEGRQPVRTSDGSVLVFNGEIYGIDRLSARLRSAGVATTSRSDSVILGEAVVRWGTEILPDLDGMFAFALWNPFERVLLLARDRWGEKPLYTALLPNGGLAFASEPQAIRPWPGVDWTLDESALTLFLAHSYIPGRQTGWQGVEKFRPGECWRWSPAGLTCRKYAAPSSVPASDAAPPLGDHVSMVRTAIEHTVGERLVSDFPVGLLLSGGIDSSTVAAVATEKVGPLPAWTVAWKDQEYDESVHARRVAEHLRLPHNVVQVEPDDVLAHLDDLLDGYGEPFGDESLIPTGLICRAAAAEVRVLLSGDGGDEMFGGYDRYFWRSSTIEEYLDTFCAARSSLLVSLLADREAAASVHAVHARLAATQPQSCGYREIRRRLDFNTYLPDDILTKVDRASMRASIEVRPPILGLAVGELAMTLPPARLWESRSVKSLLKESVVDLLPPEIVNRRKQGFGVPLARWFRGPLKGWLRDRLLGGALRAAGFFKDGMIGRVLLEHQAGRNHARLLFNLIVLDHWLRREEHWGRCEEDGIGTNGWAAVREHGAALVGDNHSDSVRTPGIFEYEESTP